MRGVQTLAGAIGGLCLLVAACGRGGAGIDVSISPTPASSPAATATVTSAPAQPTKEVTPTPVESTAEAEPPGADEYAGWETYTSEKFRYTLKYPGDAQIMGSDIDQFVQFVGPLVENESWPVLGVEHFDADFYHPPPGTDVYQWVIDSVPYDEIGPERNVAGLSTVHLIQERSPQTYAADEYYFIRDNQLFSIVILHAGDRQDWDLYNKFLDSFTFL